MLFTKKNKDQEKNEKPVERSLIYQGNGFTIERPEGWKQNTVHLILGPVQDRVQHNIIVTVDEDLDCKLLSDYAEMQVTALEQQLIGYRLLKREDIFLTNGTPAHKIIFRWDPTDQFAIYQEQIYVFGNGMGYKITASFSRKTRKMYGKEIEKIMLSFQCSSV
jgi:hypothetical protein